MTLVIRLAEAIAALSAALVASIYALALSAPAPAFARSLFPAAYHEEICEKPDAGACGPAEARQAAAHAPLGAPALTQALSKAYEEGGDGDLRPLAGLVLSQDPRSELARIVIAEDALSRGDRAAFLELYLPLFATDRRQAGVYADVLAAVSGDRDLFGLVERHVQEAQPYWGGLYLSALAGTGQVPLGDMMALYAEFPSAQPGLLGKLTASGRWTSAYVIFTEFLSIGALRREAGMPPLSVPFNPQLLDLKAPAPFNWRIQGQGAEWLEGGGVYAFFQGRRGETFLVQSFPLPAGNWRLVADMSGDVSETGGWFRWQVACAGGAPVLARLEIHELSAAPAEYAFPFTHAAAGCEFVTLSLIGVPGTFPQPARIEVRSVHLERAEDEEPGP